MSDVLGAGKAIEKLMDPVADLVKKLAGPAAEEVGLTLQDSVKVWRAKRQYRLFEKMTSIIRQAGFQPNPIELKVLLPALDYAAVEDNEELHTKWANLLANASDPRKHGTVLPVFGIILRELTATDAAFLSNFFDETQSQLIRPNGYQAAMLERFFPWAKRAAEVGEYFPHSTMYPALRVTIDTLERCGLITRSFAVLASDSFQLPTSRVMMLARISSLPVIE